nr:hypothetical protein [Salinigranum marinum]
MESPLEEGETVRVIGMSAIEPTLRQMCDRGMDGQGSRRSIGAAGTYRRQ